MEVTVRLGDSLWYYSQLFGLPLHLILDSNPTEYQRSIRVGDCVKIPGFVKEPYRIKAGDTIWKLAQQQNISMDALLLLNAKQPQSNLQVGETIELPLRLTERVISGKKEYTYPTLVEDLRILQDHYPFIKVKSVGESVLGNDIYELEIGNGPKKVHMNGSFHANEWITTAIIMQFVNDMLYSLTNNGSLNGIYMLPFYHEVTLSIVPMVNPDGVNLVLLGPPEEEPYHSKTIEINNGSQDFTHWKANIQGIDLNNQYPAYWEIEKERKEPKKPAPRDYPGDAPLTEPESIAMAKLTEDKDFHRIVAFHTQGKELYWGYLDHEPQEAGRIASEFERLSGYKAIQHIDSHAGYRDWFIYKWKRPGFTIELGEGVNPLPLSQYDEIYRDSLGIFLASLYM